ncbi:MULTISPECIES: hypothetical protein [Mycolicibacter]|uniref:Type IV secretion system protein VirB4 n=1 Tax=Mycolicibacter longobardus TaxID=1108812 RepID=A0A1X1YBV3_9MYCO|nr:MULTISPECIES: hypothetical protein [Mycolicibacter]ORW08514.1 hypothetical protein AWC16_19135 [Mycolicibacter longobardus]RAV04375.1 hypothetical protein DQP56_00725 [Mycolicibacter senuensis]
MGDYFPRITRRIGNLIYNSDGTVWANYLLRGINTDPYQPGRIEQCQDANAALFTALSRLHAADFLLLGIKAQTPADLIMERASAGIPGFGEPGRYPALLAQYNALYARINAGELAEYQRIYWLSIGLPTHQSLRDKILSSVAIIDPHQRVDERIVRSLEKQYFEALPRQFRPIRTTPAHVRWVFDRARQRAITVPELPPAEADRAVIDDSPSSFAQIDINKNADTDALLDDLVDKVADGEPSVDPSGKSRGWAGVLRDNFDSTRWGRMLSIANVETRNADFPNGYTSYQVQMGIAQYPSVEGFDINAFTYLVDQEIGCDADFALRFHFDQEVLTKRGMRKAMKELNAEANANITDEFDGEEFADRRGEMRNFRHTAKSERDPRGMKVAVMFSFAHQNRPFLEQRIAELYAHFVKHDFTPYLPVGGQFDMWQAMMPGSSCPPVVEQIKQTTTARLFSSYIPVRRTVIGDAIGVPIGINEENALGQIVHWDIFNASDKGNASATVSGAKNKGKSYLIKEMLAWLMDTDCYAHVIDQSDHGEYMVFAQTLTSTEVIDVFGGVDALGHRVSMDVLKCCAPDVAAWLFLDLWLPLLGLESDSEAATLLSATVEPGYRKSFGIASTRALMNHLEHAVVGDAARELARKLNFWARQPYTHAFIDPIIDGAVREHDPFNASAHAVVFRTHKLNVHRGENSKPTEPQRFAAMAYTAVARLTTLRFGGIKEPCALVGDEMHFQKGSDVLLELIERPDRVGRRANNFFIAGAQLASDFDEHYRLVKRKVLLGQETRANAAEALAYGDMPPTERLVDRMVTDTSPLDPDNNNMPIPSRAGEGWYNDGNNIGRFKGLPQLLAARRKYADTTASRVIRETDLPGAVAEVAVGMPR